MKSVDLTLKYLDLQSFRHVPIKFGILNVLECTLHISHTQALDIYVYIDINRTQRSLTGMRL
jgi:hypothetical protein